MDSLVTLHDGGGTPIRPVRLANRLDADPVEESVLVVEVPDDDPDG